MSGSYSVNAGSMPYDLAKNPFTDKEIKILFD